MCALIQIILGFSALVYQVSAQGLIVGVEDGNTTKFYVMLDSSTMQSITPKDVTKFGPSIARIPYNALNRSMGTNMRNIYKDNPRLTEQAYAKVSITSAETENTTYSSWKLARYFRITKRVEKTSTVKVIENAMIWSDEKVNFVRTRKIRIADVVTINGCTWGQVTYEISSMVQDAADLLSTTFETNDPNLQIEGSDTNVYLSLFLKKQSND